MAERGAGAPGAGRAAPAGALAAPPPAAVAPRGELERLAPAFFIASLVMALAVLLWNAARSYAQWPNTSDDMFYYLVLVRETAAHGVVSADGLRLTNGFHPLWFLILSAIRPLVAPPALPGAALAILALFHGLASLLLWRTLRRLAGPAPAALIAALYAASPFLLRVVFAAVETALAACCAGLALWAHLRWLERRRRLDRSLALAALMLAVAARTDTVMLAAGLAGGLALLRLRQTHSLRVALEAIDWAPVMVAALPVLAFGLWSERAGGEFLQTSGRSLSFWQSVGDWRLIRHAVAGLGPLAAVATPVVYSLEVMVQFAGWLTRAPIELVAKHPLGLGIAVGLALARHAVTRAQRPATGAPAPEPAPGATAAGGARRRLAAELVTFQILLWAFYALLFRHCQIWYWHTSLYCVALLAGVWLAPLAPGHGAGTGPRLAVHLPRVVAIAILLVALLVTGQALLDYRPRAPREGAAGAPAADPLAQVPDGATLGAFDTGQLAWETPRLTVVNLDGLVNNGAYRALRARRIGAYMREQGVEWLYVRDKVVERFRAFGLDAWLEAAEPVGRSADGVGLYRLRPSRR